MSSVVVRLADHGVPHVEHRRALQVLSHGVRTRSRALRPVATYEFVIHPPRRAHP